MKKEVRELEEENEDLKRHINELYEVKYVKREEAIELVKERKDSEDKIRGNELTTESSLIAQTHNEEYSELMKSSLEKSVSEEKRR